MKPASHALSLLLFFFLSNSLHAQQIEIPEPDFSGIILLVRDQLSGEQLEKQKASSGSKASVGAALFGVAKAKGMNFVNGAKSPVRMNQTNSIRLIVKANDNLRDPMEVINLFSLEPDPDKDRRMIVTGTVNFNKSTAAAIEFLPFRASKYQSSSYLLEIPSLPPGEYALTLDGTRDVFNMFGVDPE